MHTFSFLIFFFSLLFLFCSVLFSFLLMFQADNSLFLFHFENLILHIFLIIMIIVPCSGMFRKVPGCSGMFHVPDFIDGLLHEVFARKLWSKVAVDHRRVFPRTYPRQEPSGLVHSTVVTDWTKVLVKFYPLSLLSILTHGCHETWECLPRWELMVNDVTRNLRRNLRVIFTKWQMR